VALSVVLICGVLVSVVSDVKYRSEKAKCRPRGGRTSTRKPCALRN